MADCSGKKYLVLGYTSADSALEEACRTKMGTTMNSMRELFTAVAIKITDFWGVMLYSMVEFFCPENGVSRFL